ncbi:MAG: YIP1 family protein [Chloroflexi bacterium]|nr:YIP1 family protein [Chloroflexota bacterium]
MFQEMINGSIAVLTRPSVATFEEYEKNNLGWALIYSVIAGVINAIISAIRAALFPVTLNPEMQAQLEASGIDPTTAAAQPGLFASIVGTIIATVIGLLIVWGLTYLLGRAFGGTGEFGELAYDMALFGAPLTVIASLLGLIPILGSIAAIGVAIYNLYLTYLAIQSGMNLPGNKALYVILIQFAIFLAIGLCIALFFAAVIAAIIGASGGFAP